MNGNYYYALRPCFLLIVLAILILPALSFSTTVAQVASSYVEPQERYELNKLTVSGNDYWIVTIDGVETFMINNDAQIMLSVDSIAAVLVQNIKETSGVQAKTQQIRDLINSFNQSQYPERKVCERTTGVDIMPCYDKDTCIKACYRVPLCAMQIREDLVLAIRDWNAERLAVDAAILAATEKAKNPESEQDYRDLGSLISTMSDAMQKMEDNRLYDYPYCEDMGVTYNNAKSAKEIADNIADTLGTIPQARDRADKIYAQTGTRMNYWKERERMYSDGYIAVYDTYTEVKSMYSRADWMDNATAAAIEEAKNYSEVVRGYKEAGKYKLAIKQANQYKEILSKLKISIQITNAQYDLLKSKAKTVLGNIDSTYEKLNGTRFAQNLTAYKKEVDGVLNKKVEKSQISALIERMDEINASVKEMLAEAVLGGEINNKGDENRLSGVPNIPPINDGEGTMGSNLLCNIISTISSLLGFSVDFLGVCK